MTSFLVRLKSVFGKSRFANPESAVRLVSLIAGGTVIAQAVGILTIPIVSRIYSPADYGIMAVYASLIAILGEFSSFHYHWGITLPKGDRYAKALVLLSLIIQLLIVAFLAILLIFAGEFLLTMLSMPDLIPYRALIPLGILVTGTYLVLRQWAIREQLFSTIARTTITQALSGVTVKIALGLLGMRPLGLLIGTIAAQGSGITTLLRSLLKKKGLPRLEREDLRRVALRYRKFPMYDTWGGFVNTLGQQIMPVFLFALYNPQVAGFVAMGQRLLHLPAVFIGQAIGQIFLQRASVAKHKKELGSLSIQAYSTLLNIGLIPILLISFFAPSIFSLLLGDRWVEAGLYARALGPWVAVSFAYSPITMLYVICERQRTFLILETVHLLLKAIAMYLGFFYGTALTSITFISIIGVLFSLGRGVELLASCGISVYLSLKVSAKIILKSLLIVSFPVISYALDAHLLLIFIALAISLAIYSRNLFLTLNRL